MMRLVRSAATYPMRCAALPVLGSNHRAGYIDTGAELPGGRDNHVYVSVVAAQQMARLMGWVAPGEVTDLARRATAAEARTVELEADLAAANAALDAVSVVKARKQKVKEAV